MDGSSVPDYDVIFLIGSNDCLNPTLSVRYEAIDFSESTVSETFNVFDNDGSLITNCAGGGQCAAWQTCLDSADVLGVNKIEADPSYTITIEPADGFHKLCSNINSFHATVTLHCGVTSRMFT